MKPTKNRVYCTDAQKAKMLFESQKKADNFIKFNTEEMLEEGKKVPVRSYYCEICCGWHVTSNPNPEVFRYSSRYEMIKVTKERLQKKIAEEHRKQGLINDAQNTYNTAVETLCKGDYKSAMKNVKSYISKLTDLKADIVSFRMGYKLLYDIMCKMIPEMFAYLDSDVQKAQSLYAHCCNLRDFVKDVQGFDEYKTVTNGYLNEASEKIKEYQRMREAKATIKAIKVKIDRLPVMVQQGLFADVETCINESVESLSKFVENNEVRDLVMECVNKMFDVRKQMYTIFNPAA